MLKKTITYIDYDGNERKEDFYFNLSKAELMMMDMSVTGGMKAMLEKIVATQDTPSIANVFKDIIQRSYGEKSADGKRFVKSEELTQAFVQTEAYSELFMELATNEKAAAEFIHGVIPQSLVAELDKQEQPQLN